MTQPGPSGSAPSPDDVTSELESFRQQWRAEVRAKAQPSAGPQAPQAEPARTETAQTSKRAGKMPAKASAPTGAAEAAAAEATEHATSALRSTPGVETAALSKKAVSFALPEPARASEARLARRQPVQTPPASDAYARAPPESAALRSSGKTLLSNEFDDDYAQPRSFDEVVDEYGRVVAGPSGAGTDTGATGPDDAKAEPETALEHFERAVEKEELGSLGDSLHHYRKAFRMDNAVDKKYKNKHFPAVADKGRHAATSTTTESAATETETEPADAHKAVRTGPPPSLKELIRSFAGMQIEGAAPPFEGMPTPPCPIQTLPDELLVHILQDVADEDVGDYVRLARVCRKLAFLVATEDSVWGRVCLQPRFGFAHMHRTWQTQIDWAPVDARRDAEAVEAAEVAEAAENETVTQMLRRGARSASSVQPAYPSWQRMFRLRPRLRFNGCYISTVNYIRAGQPSSTLVTWNSSPVHIVTYFRYLRFFRDGTVISLLTTLEPTAVVHVLTKEHMAQHAGGAQAHLPSAFMQGAHRGRWRMSGISAASANDEDDLPAAFASPAAAIEAESDLVVETEGVGKYFYRMELGFRTAGKGTRNNKLNWRGFYSYDRLTDDWGEFTLKNYRPFFFSRVRSYGIGG